MPVPVNGAGKRIVNGWEFHYEGWSLPEDEAGKFRDGASREDMFPVVRKGSLDQNILGRLGLTPKRMANKQGDPDALWFHQLLLPIHHINKEKGIEPTQDDPR